MKKKTKYLNDGPIEKIKITKDFLPSPAELGATDEKVKVTISLSKKSLDFFKENAKRHKTQYQKMIRNLLDSYVSHYQNT